MVLNLFSDIAMTRSVTATLLHFLFQASLVKINLLQDIMDYRITKLCSANVTISYENHHSMNKMNPPLS